jgi:hypothetical protein
MALNVQSVEQALAPLRTGVQADGFDLMVESVQDGVARVRVLAGPSACEECLVPKSIMSSTIRRSLRTLPEIRQVDLRYPLDT